MIKMWEHYVFHYITDVIVKCSFYRIPKRSTIYLSRCISASKLRFKFTQYEVESCSSKGLIEIPEQILASIMLLNGLQKTSRSNLGREKAWTLCTSLFVFFYPRYSLENLTLQLVNQQTKMSKNFRYIGQTEQQFFKS